MLLLHSLLLAQALFLVEAKDLVGGTADTFGFRVMARVAVKDLSTFSYICMIA